MDVSFRVSPSTRLFLRRPNRWGVNCIITYLVGDGSVSGLNCGALRFHVPGRSWMATLLGSDRSDPDEPNPLTSPYFKCQREGDT